MVVDKGVEVLVEKIDVIVGLELVWFITGYKNSECFPPLFPFPFSSFLSIGSIYNSQDCSITTTLAGLGDRPD